MQASPYSQYFNQNFENQPMNMQLALALRKTAYLVEDAKKAIRMEDFVTRLNKMEQATKIILLLKDSLIESDVPEIRSMVNNISKFYSIVLKLFNQIDLKNDISYANQAISSLNDMAETWQNIKTDTKMQKPVHETMPLSLENHNSLEIFA